LKGDERMTKKKLPDIAETVHLKMSRFKGETWRNAVIRLAKVHELDDKVKQSYDWYRNHDCGDQEAGWRAAYEWDIMELAVEK